MPVGSLMSLASPINAANTALSIGIATNVLQASAKEYSDSMRLNCTKVPDLTGAAADFNNATDVNFGNLTINPYASGTLGNWRTKRNFVYYDTRNYSSIPATTAIRTDGIIPKFIPYWSFDAPSNKYLGNVTNDNRWVRSDSVQLYDNRGNEIESIDANNIVSAAYYGYNKTQVVAVTANSMHQEQTFESFEDYNFMNDCSSTTPYINDKNIRFYTTPKTSGWGIVDTVSHTGRYSLAVNAGRNLSISSKISYNTCLPITVPPPACPPLKCPDFAYLLRGTIVNGGNPTQEFGNAAWADSCMRKNIVTGVIDSLVKDANFTDLFSPGDNIPAHKKIITYTAFLNKKQVGSCSFGVAPSSQRSLSVPTGRDSINSSAITSCLCNSNNSFAVPVFALAAAPAANSNRSPIVPLCSDCLPLFSLLPSKKYILSYWVASDSSLTCNTIPYNVGITISNGATSIPLTLVSTSPVIDGWKKVEVTFTSPDATGYADFGISNTGTIRVFFDDIRVYPYNAKMKSYAYDTRSRRLMAELDENNYATFYEYDDEGILVRIKRETETGIQTVKEARNYLVPNN
jgi:hypothetical protein